MRKIKITFLAENSAEPPIKSVHGLSLYVETGKHKLLFDVGPDETAFINAELLGIDLKEVDTVIISHGHNDHGGALEKFIGLNKKAKIYIQESAFLPHYRKIGIDEKYNGLDAFLSSCGRFIKLRGDHDIDSELSLFTFNGIPENRSTANDTLFDKDGLDGFGHEQNLIIKGEEDLLIMGCGHNGVTNIMKTASMRKVPRYCIGGFHLMNPSTGVTVSEELLSAIAKDLSHYETTFYTCHCTGEKAFDSLKSKGLDVEFIHAGNILETEI